MTHVAERVGPLDTPAPASRGWRGWPVVIGVVVCLGVVLRFLARSPLWLDEAQSVAIARLPVTHGLFGALREDGSPPLYYLLLHVWMGVFGTGDLAARSLSGVCAVAALPLLYRLAPPPAAAVTVAVAAVNPWLVRYATEARMYSLEVLLVLVGLVALRALRRRPGPLPAVAVAVVAGLLLLTHYWALFLYAVTLAAVAVGWVLRRTAWLRWALLALPAGALLFLPWVPSFLFQTHHTGTPWSGGPGLDVIVTLVTEWSSASTHAPGVLVLLVWPLIVWGMVRGGRDAPVLAAVGAGTVLLALGASRLTGAAVQTRYTAVVVPVVLLLLGAGVAALPGHWRTGLCATLVVAWLVVDGALVGFPRTQAGSVATVLNRDATDRDTVLFCPDQVAPAVVRRLRVQPAMRTYPAQSWPGRLDWTDYQRRVLSQNPTALATPSTFGSGSVWLVVAPGYPPLGNRCQILLSALTTTLGPGRQVIPVGTTNGDREALWRWQR